MSIQQTQVFFSCSSLCIAPIPAVILIQQLMNTYCMIDIKWWYLTSKNLKCTGQKGVKTEEVSAVEVWVRPQATQGLPRSSQTGTWRPLAEAARPISLLRSPGTEKAGGADAKPGET